MDTNLFTVVGRGRKVTISFKKASVADAFARMEFYSRILHSLSPDTDRVWHESARLDAEIVGWPKNIKWVRTSETSFVGTRTQTFTEADITQYAELLNEVMAGITLGETSLTGVKLYRFRIRNGEEILEYRFHGKGRTIAAFCVLFDMRPHPRNDLEINIPRYLAIKEWPEIESVEVKRTYGDPSKTADELRNEGWSRMGENSGMQVSRDSFAGQIQQTYTLLRTSQHMGSQMQRSNISRRWKESLYASQNHTCQICLTQYDSSLLEPDHRIPVIYEADQLTEENYLEKLMTLCRFCNQQKRETTKRLPANYDWQNSPWAFPEKFELQIIKTRLQSYKDRTHSTRAEIKAAVSDLLDELT